MAFGQVLPQVMATGLLGNYSLEQTPTRTVPGPHMCHPSVQERSGAAMCPDHHGWDPDPTSIILTPSQGWSEAATSACASSCCSLLRWRPGVAACPMVHDVSPRHGGHPRSMRAWHTTVHTTHRWCAPRIECRRCVQYARPVSR